MIKKLSLKLRFSTLRRGEVLRLIIITSLLIDSALFFDLLANKKLGIFFAVGVYCISFFANKEFNVFWLIPIYLLISLYSFTFLLVSLLSHFLLLQILVSALLLLLIAIMLSKQYDNQTILTVIGYYCYIVFLSITHTQFFGASLAHIFLPTLALFLGGIAETLVIQFLIRRQEQRFSYRSEQALLSLSKALYSLLRDKKISSEPYKLISSESYYVISYSQRQRRLYTNFYEDCDRLYSTILLCFNEMKREKREAHESTTIVLDFLYFVNMELNGYIEYLRKRSYNNRYLEYIAFKFYKYTNNCLMRLDRCESEGESEGERLLYLGYIHEITRRCTSLFKRALAISRLETVGLYPKTLREEWRLYTGRLMQHLKETKSRGVRNSFSLFHFTRIMLILVPGEIFLYHNSSLFFWSFFIAPLLMRDYAKTVQTRINNILIGSILGSLLGLILFDNVGYLSYKTRTLLLITLYPLIFVLFNLNYIFYSALQVIRSILQLNVLFDLNVPILIRFLSTAIASLYVFIVILITSPMRDRSVVGSIRQYRGLVREYILGTARKNKDRRQNIVTDYLDIENTLKTTISFHDRNSEREKLILEYIQKIFLLATFKWNFSLEIGSSDNEVNRRELIMLIKKKSKELLSDNDPEESGLQLPKALHKREPLEDKEQQKKNILSPYQMELVRLSSCFQLVEELNFATQALVKAKRKRGKSAIRS